MKRNHSYPIVLILLILGLLASCQSVPESIPEDLAPNEYFQKGQEAASRSNYEAALLYYHTFVERHPDKLQKVVEAEYEIAFIYYKSGDLDTARGLFEAIVEKYSQPGSELLPAWPNILSAKLLLLLEEKEAETETAAPTAEE